jgi:hypothetical protein
MDEDECVYCGTIVPEVDVPEVDDEEAWEGLACFHAPGCEWVLTRAHRREFDPNRRY